MKRASFRAGQRSAESGGEQGFWPSYADMMSAVALILFFLMLLSYIQNLITGNDLQNTQELLTNTQQEVAAALLKLQNLSDELKLKQDEVDLKQGELDDYALQILAQTEKIDEQNKLIADQQSYLLTANNELVEMRNQMQTIAVLRLSILEQIKQSIAQVMGDASKVSIGENGNIILSEGVFFDVGSSSLKPESELVLAELSEVFVKFLSDPENAKYVDSIVISGHTDSTGSDEDNRVLSSARANSVLNYLLGYGRGLEKYSNYFCAAGYGETRPVASNDTAAGQAANRRIEISMILKDDSVLDIVDQYLALELPDKSMSLSDAADAATGNTDKLTLAPSPTPAR